MVLCALGPRDTVWIFLTTTILIHAHSAHAPTAFLQILYYRTVNSEIRQTFVAILIIGTL